MRVSFFCTTGLASHHGVQAKLLAIDKAFPVGHRIVLVSWDMMMLDSNLHAYPIAWVKLQDTAMGKQYEVHPPGKLPSKSQTNWAQEALSGFRCIMLRLVALHSHPFCTVMALIATVQWTTCSELPGQHQVHAADMPSLVHLICKVNFAAVHFQRAANTAQQLLLVRNSSSVTYARVSLSYKRQCHAFSSYFASQARGGILWVDGRQPPAVCTAAAQPRDLCTVVLWRV